MVSAECKFLFKSFFKHAIYRSVDSCYCLLMSLFSIVQFFSFASNVYIFVFFLLTWSQLVAEFTVFHDSLDAIS